MTMASWYVRMRQWILSTGTIILPFRLLSILIQNHLYYGFLRRKNDITTILARHPVYKRFMLFYLLLFWLP